MRILLIEDEKKTAAFIRKGLEEEGYAVEVARDGEAGLQLALAAQFDLFLIDVMLPKKDPDSFSHGARQRPGSG